MNLRTVLSDASGKTDVSETNKIEMVYNEQFITDGTNIIAGGGEVRVTYVKTEGTSPGHFSTSSTTYTLREQPFVKKSGDDMSGELINSTRFEGGFAIESRPVIGE